MLFCLHIITQGHDCSQVFSPRNEDMSCCRVMWVSSLRITMCTHADNQYDQAMRPITCGY